MEDIEEKQVSRSDDSRKRGVFSKQFISRLKPAEREYRIWDTKSQGLGVRVTRNTKTFFVAYRSPSFRWERISIGRFGDLSVEDARDKAHAIRRDAANGIDPRKEIKRKKDIPTVDELCRIYMENGVAFKKASTIATDRGRIARHIIPQLGNVRIDQLQKSDIQRFLLDVADGKTAIKDTPSGKARGRTVVTGGKGTATRTVGLLGAICEFAVEQGLLTENPCRGIKRFPDKRMNRFLDEVELSRLGNALVDAQQAGLNEKGIAVIKLLVLTGARKSEIEGLRWKEIDFAKRILNLSDTKTGLSLRPLASPAAKILEDLPRNSEVYVFPARRGTGHYVGTPKVWSKVKQLAGLTDVRLHDLRHTAASVAVSNGTSLLITGALLGHKYPGTTQRYAHLSDNPVQNAAETVGIKLASALSLHG